MTAQILDGTATLKTIKAELAERVAALKERGITPGLGTVLVGDDPGSHWYVGAKHKDCAEIGITSIRRDLPATATQAEVEAVIDELNADPACTGFIVQQPTGLDEFALLVAGRPRQGRRRAAPDEPRQARARQGTARCRARRSGSIELLRRHGVQIAGAEVVVVGRGLTVGRPLGLLLTRRTENATVTLCHTGTRDLAAHVREADIVVAAAGVPGIITAEMVKPGAAVLDVGVSRVDGKIAGDVAGDVAEVAGWVSPNPGGVGPMTRAMLLSATSSASPRRRHTDARGAPRARRRPTDVPAESAEPAGPSLPLDDRRCLYLVLLAASTVGLWITARGDWRLGVRWIAGSLIVAAVLRLVLPARDAGMLAVRRRSSTSPCSRWSGSSCSSWPRRSPTSRPSDAESAQRDARPAESARSGRSDHAESARRASSRAESSGDDSASDQAELGDGVALLGQLGDGGVDPGRARSRRSRGPGRSPSRRRRW